MTHFRPASNLTARSRLEALGSRLFAAALLLAVACSTRTPPPPFAEFVIAAGDSAFWVRSDGAGVRMRGAPLVLSRLGGRFYELYVEDDVQSFDSALFVGEVLY